MYVYGSFKTFTIFAAFLQVWISFHKYFLFNNMNQRETLIKHSKQVDILKFKNQVCNVTAVNSTIHKYTVA